MAGRIDGPWNPALDANGDPISGATIEFKLTQTNTAKAAYPSAADANAATNAFTSQTADAAGRFDPAFGPDDARYRVVWKDAAGATIETYDDVEVQGSTSGEIYRDLDSNGRFQVYGADGKGQLEFGDPTGDDTGGDGRIGGWDSTQGTTLEIDFADVTTTGNDSVAGNSAIGGELTVGGLEVGLLRVGSGTATAQTTFDVALPTDSESYIMDIRAFSVATDREILAFRAGFATPSVIRSTDYAYVQTRNSAGTPSGGSGGSLTQAPLTWEMNEATINHQALRLRISTRGGNVSCIGSYEGDVGAGAVRSSVHTEAWNEGNTGPATSIRFLCANAGGAATGNAFSLTYTLWKVLTA
jgi:hypothetical protein